MKVGSSRCKARALQWMNRVKEAMQILDSAA